MKSLILRAVHRLGYDVRRYTLMSSDSSRTAAMLEHQGVSLILDVGANVGQYGRALRSRMGYCGRIVSFEPLRSAYDSLCKLASKDALWDVAPRMAVGAEDGEIEINVAANSVSSSILPMLDAHVNAAPESRYVGTETVPLRRLDSLAEDYVAPGCVTFLKIDAQGYEVQVLSGGEKLLQRLAGVQLELSLQPLYRGERLMSEMINYLEGAGFSLWGLSPAFVEPKTGRTLQVDGVFFREGRPMADVRH